MLFALHETPTILLYYTKSSKTWRMLYHFIFQLVIYKSSDHFTLLCLFYIFLLPPPFQMPATTYTHNRQASKQAGSGLTWKLMAGRRRRKKKLDFSTIPPHVFLCSCLKLLNRQTNAWAHTLHTWFSFFF